MRHKWNYLKSFTEGPGRDHNTLVRCCDCGAVEEFMVEDQSSNFWSPIDDIEYRDTTYGCHSEAESN